MENATAKQLQNIEILGRGTGINFPDIDAGFYVPSLIEGVYGNRRWMSELGKRGGSARTEAKQIASRANGAKGGRPRKVVDTRKVAAAAATKPRKVANIPAPGKQPTSWRPSAVVVQLAAEGKPSWSCSPPRL
jgi:hypothetical protein